ncbi:MAG: hypothetical protein ACRD0F_06915, partial [Acidimicrobiales bacterium]
MDLLTRPEVITAMLTIVGTTLLALALTRPTGSRFALRRGREADPDGPRSKSDVTFHVVNSDPDKARP